MIGCVARRRCTLADAVVIVGTAVAAGGKRHALQDRSIHPGMR